MHTQEIMKAQNQILGFPLWLFDELFVAFCSIRFFVFGGTEIRTYVWVCTCIDADLFCILMFLHKTLGCLLVSFCKSTRLISFSSG